MDEGDKAASRRVAVIAHVGGDRGALAAHLIRVLRASDEPQRTSERSAQTMGHGDDGEDTGRVVEVRGADGSMAYGFDARGWADEVRERFAAYAASAEPVVGRGARVLVIDEVGAYPEGASLVHVMESARLFGPGLADMGTLVDVQMARVADAYALHPEQLMPPTLTMDVSFSAKVRWVSWGLPQPHRHTRRSRRRARGRFKAWLDRPF